MKQLITIVFLLLIIQLPTYAGGPFYSTVKDGMALTYNSKPLIYRFDQGPLGMFSNSEAIEIVKDIFKIWEDVETANLKFQQDNPSTIGFDVNGTNFEPILRPTQFLGYTPIVFDHDGAVNQAVYGSANVAVAFAGPLLGSDEILESQIVINGRLVDGISNSDNPEVTLEFFKIAVLHEIGHALGLDHSQINKEADNLGASQEIIDSVPIMFPYPPANSRLLKLKRDDISAISLLYPDQTKLNTFASIEGKVLRQDGITPVQGANVIARNIDDPLNEAVSCVSDYLIDNSGSFTLFALPPGSYTVEVEPIDFHFSSFSTVGPFTMTETDISLQNEVLKGFYNDTTMSLTRNKNEASLFTLNGGEKISDLNIITETNVLLNEPQQTIIETEPNDLTDASNLITIPTKVAGAVSSNDTEGINIVNDTIKYSDLYKINIGNPTEILATLDIKSNFESNNLDLIIFNKDASQTIDLSNKEKSPKEVINIELQEGTYLIGVGAKTGLSNYTLTLTGIPAINTPGDALPGPTPTSTPEVTSNTPEISTDLPEFISLKNTSNKSIVFNVESFNFSEPSLCTISSLDKSLKISFNSFLLDNINNTVTIQAKFKPKTIKAVRRFGTKPVSLGISCDNGASTEIIINITR